MRVTKSNFEKRLAYNCEFIFHYFDFIRIVSLSRNSDFFNMQLYVWSLNSDFFLAFVSLHLAILRKKVLNCEIKSRKFLYFLLSGRNGLPYYSVLSQRVLLLHSLKQVRTATTSYFEILINLLRLQGLFVDLFAPYQDFQTEPEPPTAGMLRVWWSLLNMLQHASNFLLHLTCFLHFLFCSLSFSAPLAFLLYICRTVFCFIVPGKLHISFLVVNRYIKFTLAQSVSKSDFTHSQNLRIYQPKMKQNLSSEIYNRIAVKKQIW